MDDSVRCVLISLRDCSPRTYQALLSDRKISRKIALGVKELCLNLRENHQLRKSAEGLGRNHNLLIKRILAAKTPQIPALLTTRRKPTLFILQTALPGPQNAEISFGTGDSGEGGGELD